MLVTSSNSWRVRLRTFQRPARYSGVDDLGFGTPAGGRHRMTSPASEVHAPSGQRQAVATMTLGWAISLYLLCDLRTNEVVLLLRPIICST